MRANVRFPKIDAPCFVGKCASSRDLAMHACAHKAALRQLRSGLMVEGKPQVLADKLKSGLTGRRSRKVRRGAEPNT